MSKDKRKQSLLNINGFPEHLANISNDLANRYSFASEIGKGKTGVAYKIASHRNPSLNFCLKTIRADINDKQDLETIKHNLKKEVEILSSMSHRCLPTLYESNTDADPPYYIISYHPGTTFGTFKENNLTLHTQDSSIAILMLIDVFKCLHGAERTHCDLHPDNVMISSDIHKDGIYLIDFGSGHRGSDSAPFTYNKGNKLFKDTYGLDNNRELVERSEAADSFEHSDFKAFGYLLSFMEDCFFQDASILAKEAYADFAQSLINKKIMKWEEAEERFKNVLDPLRSVSENADLYLSERGEAEEIVIPVSSGVKVGTASLEVINTPIFQRLRHINQLSFCDWHYPGANHSRFEHSLGVYSIAERCVKSLVYDRHFRELFSPIQVRGFLLASLLHDIGHYPFAHVMEQYIKSRFPGDSKAVDIVSHEQNTVRLILTDSALNAAIVKYWGPDALREALNVLGGKSTILSSLLDGPIDIDKMDYLVRDAAHCGAAFGSGLDVAEILRSYRCVSIDKSFELGIAENGVAAIEGMMVLQDQMLSSIYWHPTSRSIICMFHAMVANLVKSDLGKLGDMIGKIKTCDSERQAISDVIIPEIRKTRGPLKSQLQSLADAILNKIYKKIYPLIAEYKAGHDVLPGSNSTVYGSIVQDINSTQTSVPVRWENVRKLRKAYLRAFSEKKLRIEDLHLVIDVPYGKASRRMFKVQTGEHEHAMDITKISHLKESIFSDPAAFLSPIRVYVDPGIHDKAKARLESIKKSAEEEYDRALS